MRRFDPEVWAGGFMLAVTLVPVTPVLFGALPLDIPRLAWIALYVVMVIAVVVSFWYAGYRWWSSAAFGVVIVTSWALVLTASHTGLLPVLLVVVVALSPYFVPLWAGAALIGANMLVLYAAFARTNDAVELSLGLGFYLMIQGASLLSSLAMIREQRARRELAEAHVDLQAATVMLAESARANERLRISRDLHDLIGHQLTVLALELEAAKHRAAEGAAGAAVGGAGAAGASAVAEHVERAGGVARDLLSSVRETVGELRSEGADLKDTLQRIVQDLTRPRIVLDVPAGLRLDEARTQLMVRAVQEIVTNTIRHAEARELWIEVRSTPTGLELSSQDDGHGTPDLVLGNGLRGLRERFEALGGSVVFDGTNGFSVTARAER